MPIGRFFDDANREENTERTARIKRMIRELDEDYQRIILKLSQIVQEFNEK